MAALPHDSVNIYPEGWDQYSTGYGGYPLYEIKEETTSQLGRMNRSFSYGSDQFPSSRHHLYRKNTVSGDNGHVRTNANGHVHGRSADPHNVSFQSLGSATGSTHNNTLDRSHRSLNSRISTASSNSGSIQRTDGSTVCVLPEREARLSSEILLSDKRLSRLKLASIFASIVFPVLGLIALYYAYKAKKKHDACDFDLAASYYILSQRLVVASIVLSTIIVVVIIISVQQSSRKANDVSVV